MDYKTTITLDYDLIQELKNGFALYERTLSKPKLAVGDILGIKETFMYHPKNQMKIIYKSDYERDAPALWSYANLMPAWAIKRYVKVEEIIKIPYTEYLKQLSAEVPYNRRIFGVSKNNTSIPFDRWFRKGYQPDLPQKEDVWSIKYSFINS